MLPPDFLALPDGRRIAVRHQPGAGPAVVFLPGYMSDMTGTKAAALMEWCQQAGRECLLLDYSGCGASEGAFADGTVSRWTEEVVASVRARIAGRVVLVGSSMGGWLMLLAAEALGPQIVGLVGIAPAPDFTEWGYADDEKARLSAGDMVQRPNRYGPDATPTYSAFWRDGQERRVLDRVIAFDGPVRLLHGMDDGEVPPETSNRLAAALHSQDVQVTLVKGGDHRLSRPADIALLLRTVASLIG